MNPFSPDVVAAIARHMNEDHAPDSLLICRTLGGQPAAVAARVEHVDGDGIGFVVSTPRGDVDVRLPWSKPLTERAEVRVEVVQMHERAAAFSP